MKDKLQRALNLLSSLELTLKGGDAYNFGQAMALIVQVGEELSEIEKEAEPKKKLNGVQPSK